MVQMVQMGNGHGHGHVSCFVCVSCACRVVLVCCVLVVAGVAESDTSAAGIAVVGQVPRQVTLGNQSGTEIKHHVVLPDGHGVAAMIVA